MTATLVQVATIGETAGGTSVSAVFDNTPAPGNLLVAHCASNIASAGTPTYPWGNTPDQLTTAARFAAIVSKIAGASESKTITYGNSSRALFLTVAEYAPTPGRTWDGVDQLGALASTFSSVTSLALGPTAALFDADDLVVAIASLGSGTGAAAALSGMTKLTKGSGPTTAARGIAGYAMPGSAGAASTTASWTTAQIASGLVVAYKQAGTPSGKSAGFLSLI